MVATGLVVASRQLGLAHRALALAACRRSLRCGRAAWTSHPPAAPGRGVALGLLLGEIATGGLVSRPQRPGPAASHVWPRGGGARRGRLARGGDVPERRRSRPRRARRHPRRDYVTPGPGRWWAACCSYGVCGGDRRRGRTAAAFDLAVLVGGAGALSAAARAHQSVLTATSTGSWASARCAAVAAGRSRRRARAFRLALSAAALRPPRDASRTRSPRSARCRRTSSTCSSATARWLKLLDAAEHRHRRRGQRCAAALGSAAATGSLACRARPLLIVFVRTPPHFWRSLLVRKDYEAARCAHVPRRAPASETARQVCCFTPSGAGRADAVVPATATGTWGLVYGVAAAASRRRLRLGSPCACGRERRRRARPRSPLLPLGRYLAACCVRGRGRLSPSCCGRAAASGAREPPGPSVSRAIADAGASSAPPQPRLRLSAALFGSLAYFAGTVLWSGGAPSRGWPTLAESCGRCLARLRPHYVASRALSARAAPARSRRSGR